MTVATKPANDAEGTPIFRYAQQVIDRLYDLRAKMQQIAEGGADPRMIARHALVNDDNAWKAIAAEVDARTRALLGDQP